jgi:4-carboxymuconolactone decarboxylase
MSQRLLRPPVETLTEAQAGALAEFAAVRGYPARGPFLPLLHRPALLSRARALGDYLRFDASLPPDGRELAILMTARRFSQPYEWNAHYELALAAGLPATVCDALGLGQRPTGLSADNQVLFDFCSELLANCDVSDGTYQSACARYGEAVLVDLVALVGYYTLMAMILNVSRTPLPLDATHLLPALTEPSQWRGPVAAALSRATEATV